VVALEVRRLHLGATPGDAADRWPVHGFVVADELAVLVA
jgi:hypothetical protein